MNITLRLAAPAAVLLAVAALPSCRRPQPAAALFQSADACTGCHNGLRTAAGEDVSIPREWAPTMMANAAHDPYWQASVRREIADHPDARAAIEDECSICHMPMSTFTARAAGRGGTVFGAPHAGLDDPLAADGVSCTVCHQIERDGLGSPASFSGGFAIDARPVSPRRAYGRFAIDATPALIMTTGSGFTPTEAPQIRQAELCATCHTLHTGGGHGHGALPEQVPYLEWLHSDFKGQRSCQSCHMPQAADPAPIASMAVPRPGFSRHSFPGANFLVPRLLSINSRTSGATAPAFALESHAGEAAAYLTGNSAKVRVEDAQANDARLSFSVRVDVFAGHKLPTAYPSRRAWLHVAVRDARGRTVFESGALVADGAIAGNDNDQDAARFEPHHAEITRADQVQIYESIMIDGRGSVTTGLLSAVEYVKDNRLLPRGFDKTAAARDVAVRGEAAQDPDFTGGGDRVRYAPVLDAAARPPFSVTAELCYQPIGFRWARNLRPYRAPEAARFVAWYEAQSQRSALVLATAKTIVPGARNQ